MNQIQLNTFLLKARKKADELELQGYRNDALTVIQVASLVANRILIKHPDWYKTTLN
jgi:hypothetical protein